MFAHRILPFLAVAIAMLIPAGFSFAQDVPRVALINPAKIFNEMAETKDLKQKMESDRKAIEEKERALVADTEEANKARKLFNEGSEDFQKKNQEYMTKMINLQAWRELMKLDLARQQKVQMAGLFKKIEDATKEVAEAKKLDLVVIEQRIDVPPDIDQINVDQLRALINQRSVMYSNGKLDITNDVLAVVDAKYRKK